ncbi:MAG TPA: lysine--tRNA ligase [Aggregatilineales bacterium]|nr:lysine--tRNA ligase [Anaerolineales bacterium]HRE48681.1 lysine--tRNA ligase [Aggregatilineales bacterium]
MLFEPNKLEQERLDKLERLRKAGIDPFPGTVTRTHTIQAAVKAFTAAEHAATPESLAAPIQVAVCGRLRSIRTGGKVCFAHIEDGTGRVQLFIRIDYVGEDTYQMFLHDVDLFDFLNVEGVMMRTRAGEISVEVRRLSIIVKTISPLPVVKTSEVDGQSVSHGGFTNVEERYRQRYADLAVNPEVREVFKVRSKVIRTIRNFLDDQGFLEVETPVLQPIYGGAAARPFKTHHNQLKQDLFLRISFELYLKRLLVGMYDAVYEIGRDFRNEGISFKHNTEFTMLEWYQAYVDYTHTMTLVEQLLASAAQAVTGTTEITYADHLIQFAPPWRRWAMRDAIREMAGIDYVDYPDAESLSAAMRAKGMTFKEGLPWGKLVEHLLSEFVEPTLIQPTFICDYPRDISPFAKGVPGDPLHVQRFEFYIAGMEFGNCFTELNDPLDQEQRFLDMAKTFTSGDDDETLLDEDYLRAMRYGMPPNSGVGIGIDRLVMLLTNRRTIREVLLYPHLRDKEE